MVQQVKAGFIDAQDVTSVEATFILPTKLPQERAGYYQMDSDPDNLVYRVTNRVQSNPGYPQADFGHQTTTFQPRPLEANEKDGALEMESTTMMDENTSTTESNIAAEMSILDSYVRVCSARSSVDSFPLAIRQASEWLNALDIDEPTSTRRHRSSLEWLDLASTDDITSSTRQLLDVAESLIEEPKNTTVVEPSSSDYEYVAATHPDIQEEATSQNESRWRDSIDLDAVFGGSATDLEEDFPDPNGDDHSRYQESPLNKSQWGDIKDSDASSGGNATDLEYEAKSQDNSKWEDAVDLDAVFGGSATDLEEEFDDVNSQTAAVCVANASFMEEDTGFESPNLRHHIPDDIEERVNFICQTRFSDEDGHVVAGGWALAKACAQWEYMSEAAREHKRLGFFRRQGKIPEEVNRSCATSWENEEWPTGKPSARPPVTVNETALDPCHHVNFLGEPCVTRSNTPPEDSFWVVFTSNRRFHHETFSRQGVIIAQANKLVDPFEYDPTGCDLSQLAGSELKNAVVGKVRKVYLDCGTWVDDVYSTKDHVPVPLSYESMMSRSIYWKGTYSHYSLQQPHRINNLDLEDLVVNKGEITPPKRHYREPTDLFLPGPSKLRIMELVEDEEPEARPMSPYLRSMESLSREESNEELQKVQVAAADRAQDWAPESESFRVRDGQMETRSGIDLDEGESLTSSQRDKKASRSEVEKANEDLEEIVLSVAALSTSPASSEIENSLSPCHSRGIASSVSTSSEAELTALDEEKLDAEIDILLGQLRQLQVDQKEEDVRDFVNSLPSPVHFDVLGERHIEQKRFGVEEIVRAPGKFYYNLPQERVDKEEGLLVNESMPSPENGYPELTQDCHHPTEKLAAVENASQPEDAGLARIRALEAILMQEFDFSKKSMCSSTLPPFLSGRKLIRSFFPVDIPYSDVSKIPFRQGDNERLYGPVAIAIGRKALELTDWVRSWMR